MKDEAVMTDVVEKNDSSEIKKDWYSLRVISGKERVVEESIAYEAKMNDIADTIGEVFVPFEKIVEIKNNKKVLKEKVFFPGYILINMNMNSLTKHVIENIQYVIRFVGPKGKDPIPLRDSEIKRIFGEVERKEGREMLVSPFSKGNHVKIIAGPFGVPFPPLCSNP